MNCLVCNNIHRLYECPMCKDLLRDMKCMYLVLSAIDLKLRSSNDLKKVTDDSVIMDIKQKLYKAAINIRFGKTKMKIVGVGYICSTAYRWRKDRLINEIYNLMECIYSDTSLDKYIFTNIFDMKSFLQFMDKLSRKNNENEITYGFSNEHGSFVTSVHIPNLGMALDLYNYDNIEFPEHILIENFV